MEIIFDENKERQLALRVSEEDYQFITALSKEKKTGRSTIARALIRAALNELRKLPIVGKNPLFKGKLGGRKPLLTNKEV